ncbi:type II secretion system protein [Natronincola ferrireducens]|uniref:N-terminal methylation site-containing protein n=1 Tax=Natronincola ferrireducens TaxID=393762 RepID=A0A1G9CLB3_9FIRM|nr:type II secretion system protein [Natronincola ferrireducens]SDK52490.1 N-terminal methylation site-containing protein [Natronincola ferrireducens]
MIQMFTKRMKNRKGFTLIELIVVIAILGILALIAVPRLMGFTERAKESADAGNARTLYNAITIALADNNDIELTNGTHTKLEHIDGLDVYLDEWPKDKNNKPLEAVVDVTTVEGAPDEIRVGIYRNTESGEDKVLAGANTRTE